MLYDPAIDEARAATYMERLLEYRLWIAAFALQNAMLLSKKVFDWAMNTDPGWIKGLRMSLNERFANMERRDLALLRAHGSLPNRRDQS